MVDPKEDTLKFYVDTFIGSVSRRGILGGFLIRDLEDRVILDVIDDLV